MKLFINILVLIVIKSSLLMEVRKENTVVIIAMLKIEFGGKRLEFKKLKINSLILADYNPKN